MNPFLYNLQKAVPNNTIQEWPSGKYIKRKGKWVRYRDEDQETSKDTKLGKIYYNSLGEVTRIIPPKFKLGIDIKENRVQSEVQDEYLHINEFIKKYRYLIDYVICKKEDNNTTVLYDPNQNEWWINIKVKNKNQKPVKVKEKPLNVYPRRIQLREDVLQEMWEQDIIKQFGQHYKDLIQ